MRCERCGVRLGPEARYCPVCGAKTVEDEGERPDSESRHPASEGARPLGRYDWEDDFEDREDDGALDDGDDLGDWDDPDDAGYPGELGDGDWRHVEGKLAEAGFADGADLADDSSFVEPEPWEFEEYFGWDEPVRPHPVRRALALIGVVVGVAVMVLLSLPMTSSPSGRAPVVISTPAGLYPSEVASSAVTRREVLERADELGITAWTDWRPTFDADGLLSEASSRQATDLLNLYRFVAGVDPVVSTREDDARAQAVVDVYAGTEFQAHTLTERPADMDDATFAMAREAARRSNVGVGYGDWGSDLPAYIAEVDPNPIQPNYETVGHRRHLLGTSLGNVGFGLNGPYSAIYVGEFDGGRVDETVAWPACQTPIDLWTRNSPWSVSLPYAIEDDGAVAVRIVRERDGRVWETADMAHFFIDHGSYHDTSAVVFTPADLIVESGDRYEVTIEGLPNGTLSYAVDFFPLGFDLR